MDDLYLTGIDLAKNVFQLYGFSSTGEVIFRKQLNRSKLLTFIFGLPNCTIAIEACSDAPSIKELHQVFGWQGCWSASHPC